MASSNATVLVIVNNDGEDGEKLFRVAATLGGRSRGEEEPQGPQNMATVSVRKTNFMQFGYPSLWYIHGNRSGTFTPYQYIHTRDIHSSAPY